MCNSKQNTRRNDENDQTRCQAASGILGSARSPVGVVIVAAFGRPTSSPWSSESWTDGDGAMAGRRRFVVVHGRNEARVRTCGWSGIVALGEEWSDPGSLASQMATRWLMLVAVVVDAARGSFTSGSGLLGSAHRGLGKVDGEWGQPAAAAGGLRR